MKEITKKWIKYANVDLKGARIALDASGYYASQLCILHCHQALEKILKSVLVEQDKPVKKIHDLVKILHDTGLELPEEYINFIKRLNPHYQPARYPDIVYPHRSIYRYSKKGAQIYFTKTKKIFLWVKKQLMPKR